jgi:hypothetical protein
MSKIVAAVVSKTGGYHEIEKYFVGVIMMQDIWHPTEAELRQWANDHEAIWPTEDWDLVVSVVDRGVLFLEFAADINCPNGDFILNCLYILVGDAVRTSGHAHSFENVKTLIELGQQSSISELRHWADQSRKLILHGPKFDFHAWYGCGDIK